MEQNVLEQVIRMLIERHPQTKDELNTLRNELTNKLKINQPSTRDILEEYQKLVKKKSIAKNENLERLLRKADIRSTSGISVVTSLVKPYNCPGKCIYCPTEVRMPKSYIATEPAAARALRLDFSPYEQMKQRILMLEKNGHATDKVEYIIKGGTWNAYPLRYQYWFILESFKACNETKNENSKRKENQLTEHSPLEELQAALEKEQKKNETGKHRIIGLTLETRPDAISAKTIYHMRLQGCTRIELGLQAPDDEILTLIKRGHTVQQFRDAMLLLRYAGFKVDLHFMPDLPGSNAKHDVEMYKLIFSDPGLKPDMVKIYPNTVIKTAELYQWFLDGRFTPYSDKELFSALIEMKKATPRYCRISRLIRDIPATEIEGGNIVTNLREMLEAFMKKEGTKCVCLRCREISRQKDTISLEEEPVLFVDQYDTTGGKEYFLSFEDKKRIAVYGFLRLRIPFSSGEKKITNLYEYMKELQGCAFIRELHVYGTLVEIGKHNTAASQHKGLGKKLVLAAENIIREHNFTKSAIISGVGVRDYYRKLGYKKSGTYMVKTIAE